MALARAPQPASSAEIARRIRRHIIELTAAARSGHPGTSLSCVEILVALYWHVLRVDPARPSHPNRDRFILSKGHGAPALYAVLAERGFLPLPKLRDLRQVGSPLQGHPDMHKVPGVEFSTGSLGQGLSAGVGMALDARLDGRDSRVYVLLGDGECQEGQVWEAAMAAAHYRLGRLVAIVDRNGLQIDGPTEQIMRLEPLGPKWAAFGWEVREVAGHDLDALVAALDVNRPAEATPLAVIAATVKGKGVSFMEGQVDWHGTAPTSAQAERALAELAAPGGAGS